MNTVSIKNLCISFVMISCGLQLSAHWSESVKQGVQLTAQGVKEAAQEAGSKIAESAKTVAAQASRYYQELAPVLKASKDKAAERALELVKKLSETAQQLKDTRAAQAILAGLSQAKLLAQKHPVACFAAVYATLVATSMIYGAWQHHKSEVALKQKQLLEQERRERETIKYDDYYPCCNVYGYDVK